MLKFNQKKSDKEEDSKLSNLKKEFEHAKQKVEVSPQIEEEIIDLSTYPTSGTGTTRKVRLRVGLECGCGGGWTEVEREVDFDSPLKDDDIVPDFTEDDYVL